MKKLLSILGAIALSASTSSVVVACGSSGSSSKRYSKLDWGNNDEKVVNIGGNVVTLGDLLKANESKLDDLLFNDVNEKVADAYARDYSQQNLVGKDGLGFVDADSKYNLQNPNTKLNAYSDEITDFSNTEIAANLYSQYLSAQISGTTPLDETFRREPGGHLNPSWYQDHFNLDGKWSLWFKSGDDAYKRWTTISETDYSSDVKKPDSYKDIINGAYQPTAEDLNGNNFVLAQIDGKDLGTGYGEDPIKGDQLGSLTAKLTDDQIKVKNLSGQQALLLRYQNHVVSKNTNSMINALVMEYAKNTLYKMQQKPNSGATTYETANNKGLYIDASSTVAKDIQSWTSNSSDLVTSQYKMVWSLTVPNDQSKLSAIMTAIQGDTNAKPINSKLKSTDYSLIKADDGLQKAMSDILAAAGVQDNASRNGADPYLNIKGFQGIVKDGKLVSDGTLNLDQKAIDKIKNVEGLGILTNGKDASSKDTYSFDNKLKPNDYVDYVFVMPLYLLDLLQGTSVEPAKGDATHLVNIAKDQWVPLNPQVKDAGWTSASAFTLADDSDQKQSNNDVLPTKPKLMKVDNVTYIYIPGTTDGDITITADGKSITVTPEKANDNDTSGYGVQGIYENTDENNADAWSYNGQRINYAIHLGEGSNNPNSYLNIWNKKAMKEQSIKDIQTLSNTKKTQLMNQLLASVAKNDDSLVEEAKSIIYRNYISLDDIYYQALYDKLKDYLKEDDTIEPSD